MENQTRFDLNQAVAGWRQGLPGLSSEEIRELEEHLREDTADLMKRGLGEEESFWLARRRIGPASAIMTEFEKAEPGRKWRDRVFWMATGTVVCHLWFNGGEAVCDAASDWNDAHHMFGDNGKLWFAVYAVVTVGLGLLSVALAKGWIQKWIIRRFSLRGAAWALVLLFSGATALRVYHLWHPASDPDGMIGVGYAIGHNTMTIMNIFGPALMGMMMLWLAPKPAKQIRT